MAKIAIISRDGVVLQILEDENSHVDITTHPLGDKIGPFWTFKRNAFYEPIYHEYARMAGDQVLEVLKFPSTVNVADAYPEPLVKLPGDATVTPGMIRRGEKFEEAPPAPAPSELEVAKAAFAKKWPPELQTQALLEGYAMLRGGDIGACLADELIADRLALMKLAPQPVEVPGK